jgi:hypothetical protein
MPEQAYLARRAARLDETKDATNGHA